MIIKRSNDLVENATIDRISNSWYQNANKRYNEKKRKKKREKQVYLYNNIKSNKLTYLIFIYTFVIFSSLSISRLFWSVTLHSRFKACEYSLGMFFLRKTREREMQTKQKYSRFGESFGEGKSRIIKFSGRNADYWFDYRFDYIWLRPLAAHAHASVINQLSG